MSKKDIYIYTKTSDEWKAEYQKAYQDYIDYQAGMLDVRSVRNNNDELTYNNPLEVLRAKQNLLKTLKKEYLKAYNYENGISDDDKKIGILYIGRDYGY